jgi:hypothetical protein
VVVAKRGVLRACRLDCKKYGRYLGPSRDVGTMMTSKILNDKGNTLYRLSFRALTQDELDSQKERLL